MKKTIILSILSVALFSGSSFGQETPKKERQVLKKEFKSIKKEVKMEEENGEKVLTIVTDENGKKTEEVYEGEAADQKMKEMNEAKEQRSDDQKTVEVKMVEVDGKKTLTLITKEKGEETIEVFEGEEAEAKLKEIENSELEDKRTNKKIIKEERVIEKSKM